MQVLRELLARAVLAVVGMPIVIICSYLGGWWLLALVTPLTIIALGEYYSATFRKGLRPRALVGYLAALALLVVTICSTPQQLDLAVVAVIFLAIAATMVGQFGSHTYEGAAANCAVTVFGIVYIGLLMSFFIRLANIDLPAALGYSGTLFPGQVGTLLLVLVPVWSLDTFAFAVGSAWGRHKLSPHLSPRKTIEGALAGLLGCAGITLLLGWWLHLPWSHALALGLLLGVASQVGDAAKSTIKRDLQIEDFGNIFGPHGGVLDRFDGLLFAMPTAYLYLSVFFPI